jgi:hypothetical protein
MRERGEVRHDKHGGRRWAGREVRLAAEGRRRCDAAPAAVTGESSSERDAGRVALDRGAQRGMRAVKTRGELGDRRLGPERGAELLPLALDEDAELDEPARRAPDPRRVPEVVAQLAENGRHGERGASLRASGTHRSINSRRARGSPAAGRRPSSASSQAAR